MATEVKNSYIEVVGKTQTTLKVEVFDLDFDDITNYTGWKYYINGKLDGYVMGASSGGHEFTGLSPGVTYSITFHVQFRGQWYVLGDKSAPQGSMALSATTQSPESKFTPTPAKTTSPSANIVSHDYDGVNGVFSGTDMLVQILLPSIEGYESKPLTLGQASTITYSIYRHKVPVRTLGRIGVRGFVKSGRSIAGTMIFTVFNRHIVNDIKQYAGYLQELGRIKMDELPGFDLLMTFANEYGETARLIIYGVTVADESKTFSIEDMYTENIMKYYARDIDVMDGPWENMLFSNPSISARKGTNLEDFTSQWKVTPPATASAANSPYTKITPEIAAATSVGQGAYHGDWPVIPLVTTPPLEDYVARLVIQVLNINGGAVSGASVGINYDVGFIDTLNHTSNSNGDTEFEIMWDNYKADGIKYGNVTGLTVTAPGFIDYTPFTEIMGGSVDLPKFVGAQTTYFKVSLSPEAGTENTNPVLTDFLALSYPDAVGGSDMSEHIDIATNYRFPERFGVSCLDQYLGAMEGIRVQFSYKLYDKKDSPPGAVKYKEVMTNYGGYAEVEFSNLPPFPVHGWLQITATTIDSSGVFGNSGNAVVKSINWNFDIEGLTLGGIECESYSDGKVSEIDAPIYKGDIFYNPNTSFNVRCFAENDYRLGVPGVELDLKFYIDTIFADLESPYTVSGISDDEGNCFLGIGKVLTDCKLKPMLWINGTITVQIIASQPGINNQELWWHFKLKEKWI